MTHCTTNSKKNGSLLLLLLLPLLTMAQTASPQDSSAWKFNLSQGLDLGQFLIINPRPGSGVNFINLGGNLGLSAQLTTPKYFWNNNANWQFGIQKVGSGTLPNGEPLPFSKSVDLLSLKSVAGKQLNGSRLFLSAYFSFLSQATPTYPGNYLKDVTPDNSGSPIARFFSPARLELAAALAYQSADKKLTLLFTPSAFKSVMVRDDAIAALGIHGNPVDRVNGIVVGFDNNDHQLGALLNLTYANAFIGDRLKFNSNLTLYSNYLNHPERVDVEWNGELGLQLFKNLLLSLKMNLFYDYDMLVYKTDSDKPFSEWETGRGVSFTEQLSLKYNFSF
jgi:hypothetical protein